MTTMTRMELARNLLEQLIVRAQKEDSVFKARMIAEHRGQEAMGESWMLFHLKVLRELMLDENLSLS